MERFSKSPWAGRTRWAFLAGVCAYLVWRLTGVGWSDVLASLPASPWFYAVYALIFLTLPASEVIVYRLLAGRPVRGAFPAFVRKRVFNEGVAGYSGEVYLFLRLKALKAFDNDRATFGAIRDANILSGLASNLTTLLVLSVLVASGQAGALLSASGGLSGYVAGLVGLNALLGLAFIILGGRIMSVRLHVGAGVFLINLTRTLMVMGLQVLQWSIALPDVDMAVWLVFISLWVVVKRLPFLPNNDLVFLSLAMGLSGLVAASEAEVTGMLVASAALPQIVFLIAFLLTSGDGAKETETSPERD